MKLYQQFAYLLNLHKTQNKKHAKKTEKEIQSLCDQHFKKSFWFDKVKTKLDLEVSGEKLYFSTTFFTKRKPGAEACLKEHEIIISPNLANGFTMSIIGEDTDSLARDFQAILKMEYKETQCIFATSETTTQEELLPLK